MIPDIAIMLAVYMCARLLRSAITPTAGEQTEDTKAKAGAALSICNVVDVLAIAGIVFFAHHVYTLGLQSSETLGKVASSTDDATMQAKANTNARALATAVQGKAIVENKYDPVLIDYAVDLGGSIPVNPCTGTDIGYKINVTSPTTVDVSAERGTNCGEWTPFVFSLTL